MTSPFIDACFGRKTALTPVWYMRQAGRYLPEYRQLKEKYTVLQICQTPELATQVALQPVDILGVDAAILFADIMIPLLGVGVDLEIVENIGPVIKHPIRSLQDVNKLRELNPEADIPYLIKTIQLLRQELKNRVPLIGFSAAPFTLASYLVEGKPSRDFIQTKLLMYTQKPSWDLLMGKLTDMIIVYLKSQVAAGAQALQLFDSWVGCLSETDYREYVLPFTQRICDSLISDTVPLIHFGTNTATLLPLISSLKCQVISVDWRVRLDQAWGVIGHQKAIQGNLDPVLLLGDFSLVKKRVDELFALLPKRKGYIFNLGHGVLPNTPVENLIRLTDYVHQKV